ncbi:MAG: hypothetical protein JXA66_08625 [Oligoflexia bacterium]|nr:hypothetical protein [Oligoflexia bacterium]
MKKGVLYNCSVPDHKELSIGTLLNLLKKSNLTIEDLVKTK